MPASYNPFHLRNILIQCAFDGLVEARWTDDIHAEWMRNLAANSAANALGLSTQVPVKTT